MKKIMLFIGALIALLVLMLNLGPLVLLGACIWLLYIIFKQFIKSDSTLAKIGWVILGLLVISIGLSNIYAVIGVAAAYVLYIIYKKWKEEPSIVPTKNEDDEPFIHFEEQWKELYKS